MILAVDEAIPYWREAFVGLGDIRSFSGRNLRPSDVRDADALVVRSVTRIDASLLDGSAIRFVGSATIGLDHIDEPYLQSRRIHYTNAAGSNANSVAEYITAALLVVAERKGWNLSGKSVGIIGVGNVGSRVERKVRALGMQVALCDPPLRESTGDAKYKFLEDVIDADILTLHVPLIKGGPYPTFHMIDDRLLGRLSRRQFLINSARGAVIDCPALRRALNAGSLDGAVLDVWEGEPQIDYALLDRVEIGSPHIAGYSLDGKVRGTEMIFEELCRFFDIQANWDTRSLYPAPAHLRPRAGTRDQEALGSIVVQAYDILRDDENLRALRTLSREEARPAFDRLRNDYDLRPEFRHYTVELKPEQTSLAGTLQQLGFRTSDLAPESKGS
jgi:erythronate-4-phosphate dehydrogenase